jgi:parallel beta-helix repeat protein
MKKLISCLLSCLSIFSVTANALSYTDVKDIKSDILNGNSGDIYDCISVKHEILYQNTNRVYVSNVDELKSALINAQPNDEIILKSGIYETDISGAKSSLFMSSADGTEDMPIVIRSENPDNPAILKGTDTAENIVLYITGDYWIIQDIEVSNAQKGIVLDNSNYSVIDNCEVHTIGSEGIHLRDDSSYCTVQNCFIHDTGTVSKSYGEGVYIGSSQWTSGYGYKCDYNTVRGCQFKNISAEHIDIKEFTTGTLVENCTMYGTGISGENYADSFVDIQGNSAVIRNNICYRENNSIIADAFQLHVLADGWGYDNEVYNNTVYLDDESAYVLGGWDGTVTAYDNTRIPDGNMYYGDAVTIK